MVSKKKVYARVAPLYDLLDLPFEYGRYRALRPQLFEGAGGLILDAGVGTGRNMPFFPAGSRVVGIDLSGPMLARARRRCARLGAEVALAGMDVRQLAFADRSFDRIVAAFLLCVLEPADQLPALKELARVCKADGEIRTIEYCFSQDPLRRAVMRLWAPWVRWAYGAAFDRDTERYVPEAGLELVETRYLHLDIIKMLVMRPR